MCRENTQTQMWHVCVHTLREIHRQSHTVSVVFPFHVLVDETAIVCREIKCRPLWAPFQRLFVWDYGGKNNTSQMLVDFGTGWEMSKLTSHIGRWSQMLWVTLMQKKTFECVWVSPGRGESRVRYSIGLIFDSNNREMKTTDTGLEHTEIHLAQRPADGNIESFPSYRQTRCMQPAIHWYPLWTGSYLKDSPFRLQSHWLPR